MRHTKLSMDQIRRLDTAVLSAIRAGVDRSDSLVRNGWVVRELATLPPAHQGGKSDSRYVADALQRLRRGRRVTHRGQKWALV